MNKRDIVFTSLGNLLEWYDFGLFIYLAPILGTKFFPAYASTMAVFAVFAVFAIGYLCRPLGAIVFGYLGDTQGRAKTLRYSILLMTVATLCVGLLPTYQTAGVFASTLFILLRMMQGISVGGEYCGVMIYLAESAPRQKRGLITSFAGCGANLGFLLATLTAIFIQTMSQTVLNEWGWRIPFILIGVMGTIIFYFRFNLVETKTFLHLQATETIVRKPLQAALRFSPKVLLKIFAMTCLSSTFYIVFFSYMPTYLSQFAGFSLQQAFVTQSILLFVMLLLVPLSGMLGDRYGRKNMLLLSSGCILLLVFPCFLLLQMHTVFFIWVSLSLATILSSLDQGNNLSAFVENCPAEIRYSGLAFAYNLGNGIFGGVTPLIVGLLVARVSPIAPAYYLIVAAIVSLLAIVTLFSKQQLSEREEAFS